MSVFAPMSAPILDDEPYVPSHGIVVVQFGIPHLVYHQGTHLNTWMSEVDTKEVAKEMMGDDHADGVFVWSGTIQSSRSYYGEYDAWLEASEVRPVTKEEWTAFMADEIVWDFDDMRKYLDWKWAADKAAFQEENR